METSFDEGYGVVDAHAGFIAGNDRFDQFAARSAILLTERKRRRQHFARMKRLSADTWRRYPLRKFCELSPRLYVRLRSRPIPTHIRGCRERRAWSRRHRPQAARHI